MPPPVQRLRKFRLNHPQRMAGLMLLGLLAQCLWVIDHHTLTAVDYRYAQCGRELWEQPSCISGYYTSCGNIHDGILAYRAAGLPLTIATHLTADADRSASVWELRHQIAAIRFLLLTPFMLSGLALGSCLWWVARRLFGNHGGYLALALYCVAPPILDASTHPNEEILAALGLFALVYTAIGVSHAMQAPLRKWRPRIVLLTIIFGFTAAAHLSAMLIGLALTAVLMGYLAEGRRSYLPTLLLTWVLGAMLLVFAAYGFHPDAYSYLFRSGSARLGFSLAEARIFLATPANAGITFGTASALALWATSRRSRYFGNSTALAIAALLFTLVTTDVESRPWLWAIPFLMVFIGGVFADAFETRRRKLFFALAYAIATVQTVLTVSALSTLTN